MISFSSSNFAVSSSSARLLFKTFRDASYRALMISRTSRSMSSAVASL